MNATRILWGQVIAVISVTLLGIWSATQWTAHALAHQPELGQPWFWLGPWPIYPPYAQPIAPTNTPWICSATAIRTISTWWH